jgi:hypothetical protein
MTAPRPLRRWFVIHGVVDWVFAVPLFVCPVCPEAFLGRSAGP